MSKSVAAIRTVMFVPLFFLATLIIAIYVTIVGSIWKGTPHVERSILLWSRLFLGVPPIKHQATGGESVDRDGMYVVVSNHLSNFDIPLLFRSVPVTIRFLAKKELYRIPFVAQAMHVAGIVKINRQAGMSTHEAINAGVANARARGFSLIVFAEGTRGRDGEMGDFKKGAFRIAIDNGLPVLPVVVHGTREANPPGSWVIHRAQAQVHILEPIPTDGMTVKDDIDALLKETRERMLEEYEALRRGDK